MAAESIFLARMEINRKYKQVHMVSFTLRSPSQLETHVEAHQIAELFYLIFPHLTMDHVHYAVTDLDNPAVVIIRRLRDFFENVDNDPNTLVIMYYGDTFGISNKRCDFFIITENSYQCPFSQNLLIPPDCTNIIEVTSLWQAVPGPDIKRSSLVESIVRLQKLSMDWTPSNPLTAGWQYCDGDADLHGSDKNLMDKTIPVKYWLRGQGKSVKFQMIEEESGVTSSHAE
ncbi:hypothetical protein QBC44DRAFT_308849 [Cladorrhinum sp. PSN332]|nr:hypothetical protein QBC44DRAFT_308849 [Cladorrhinum sp. PSN332]